MSRKRDSLLNQVLSGGPEEDRTPDLLIANDIYDRDINHLSPCCDAKNSGISGGVSTERAQVSARFSPYTERVTECTSASVLCERPTDHRQPVDTTVLCWALALGIALLIAMGTWTWLERKADRGGR